jgi:DNA-binding beta-propeller fold protein YncE
VALRGLLEIAWQDTQVNGALQVTKMTKHSASYLALVFLLTACGGGGGGGSGPVTPPPAVQTPQDPLPITAANANQVIALDARLTEIVVDLSSLILESIVATAESGQTVITLACDRGSVAVTLDDVNGNGLPGSNEGASMTATDCEDFDLRYIFSGTVDLTFRSFVLDQNTAAKTKMRAVVSAPMQVSDGGTQISFTGEMELDALYDSIIQSLRVYQRFGDEIALLDSSSNNTDTYSGYVVSRGISGVGELSKTVDLEIESETLNGTVTCSSPTRLIAVLGDIPDSGQLRCSGASNSAARADSIGAGVVDVVVDPEGDGTFVDAGVLPGGTGEWTDFFDLSVFALTFSLPGTIPPQTVVPIASISTNFGGNGIGINDIAKNPNNNRLYVSDDDGIRIIDAATLEQIGALVAVSDRPGPLTVSDDGSRLWFGLQDTAEIQFLNLSNNNLGARTDLGNDRRAQHIRVVPGSTKAVVVSMTNNTEMIAYSAGAALPDAINSPSAPTRFEFLDATQIVGVNPTAADHPAAAVSYGAGGLTLDVTRSQFDVQGDTAIAVAQLGGLDAGPALVSSSGRIFDAVDGTIFGRLKLNQTEPSEARDGVAVNENTGDILVYNSTSGLLESYEQTLELRGAYRLPIEGNFIRMLDAGSRMILSSNSEVHAVAKSVLTNNRNNSPCQPFDLTNQIVFGFFIQIDCGVLDVIYSDSQDLLYALLPSYSGINGNAIVRIDPQTGEILSRVYVGSEPERMVITPDESRAYVTLGESNRVAVVNLAGGADVLESYIELEPYNLNVPQFAEALAVSPTDNDVLLVGANARISVYDDGVRLGNVIAGAAIGNPRDLFFYDGNNAIAQVPTGTISRLAVGSNGVTLGTQTNGAASAGSLKLQDGKIYDRDGRVLDAATLNQLGACSIGQAMTGLLVEPSAVSDLIYYLDQSVDSVMTTCRESTFEPLRVASIPAFGDVGGMPQDLEEMGDNRLALTAGDIILLFQADAL